MDIQNIDVQNIAHIFSIIGVFVSLFYVGIQIHNHTAATRAAMYQEALGLSISINNSIADDTKLSEAYLDGLNISKDDFKFEINCMNGFRHLQHLFLLYDKKLISPSQWRTHREGAKLVLQSNRVKNLWSYKKDTFDEKFITEIEKMQQNQHTEPSV